MYDRIMIVKVNVSQEIDERDQHILAVEGGSLDQWGAGQPGKRSE